MIQKYLHDKAGFKVFMSATIGDPRAFVKIMGITNAKFIRLDNNFNYDKSPVVFVNRHKLSFREREASLPKVIKILDQIINKHKGQRGIIHCGSYDFMNYIKRKLMDFKNLFKDDNDINEKSVVGFSAFLIMVVFALADLGTGYFGKDLVINDYIYNSFVIITLGCFGIAGLEKFAKK